MRGVTAFTVVLGVVFVLSAVGLGLYLMQTEKSKVEYLIALDEQIRSLAVDEVVREESLTTAVYTFRSALLNYFNSNYLDIYEDDLDKDFLEWINAYKEVLFSAFISYLESEIRVHAGRVYRGASIEVIYPGGKEGFAELLDEKSEFTTDKGFLKLTLDFSDLSLSEASDLPRIRVCRGDECIVNPVYPLRKMEVLIPVRMEEMYNATVRVVKERGEEIKEELGVMAGFCSPEKAICGVYHPNGNLLLPSSTTLEVENEEGEKEEVEFKSMRFFLDPGKTIPFGDVTYNGMGCADVSMVWDSVGFFSCSTPVSLYQAYVNKKLAEYFQEGEGLKLERIGVDPAFLEEVNSFPVVSTQAIHLWDFLAAGLGVDLFIDLLPEDMKNKLEGATDVALKLPGAKCEFKGFVKCVYPEEFVLLVRWKDTKSDFEIGEEKPTVGFRVHLGFSDITPPTPKEDVEEMIKEQEKKAIEECKDTVTNNILGKTEQVKNILKTIYGCDPGEAQYNDLTSLFNEAFQKCPEATHTLLDKWYKYDMVTKEDGTKILSNVQVNSERVAQSCEEGYIPFGGGVKDCKSKVMENFKGVLQRVLDAILQNEGIAGKIIGRLKDIAQIATEVIPSLKQVNEVKDWINNNLDDTRIKEVIKELLKDKLNNYCLPEGYQRGEEEEYVCAGAKEGYRELDVICCDKDGLYAAVDNIEGLSPEEWAALLHILEEGTVTYTVAEGEETREYTITDVDVILQLYSLHPDRVLEFCERFSSIDIGFCKLEGVDVFYDVYYLHLFDPSSIGWGCRPDLIIPELPGVLKRALGGGGE